MFGRPRLGLRLVVLATVASTLLAAWTPPARACACGSPTVAAPSTGCVSAVPDPGPPASCECACCRNKADAGDAPRPCCLASHPTEEPAGPTATRDDGCGCHQKAVPDEPGPTAPPRPTNLDDSNAPTWADATPTHASTRPPAGPSTAAAVPLGTGPPPIDLVISLSRHNC